MTITFWYWAMASALFLGDAYACGASGKKWRPVPAAVLCALWPAVLVCVALHLVRGRGDD